MAEEPKSNNEKRTFNRRARTGWTALALVTISFYFCVLKGSDIEWFKAYALFVGAVTGFIIGGISITDGIQNWRSKQ